ncbi:MAG: cobaltochelatase subunit CobN [Clostridiales bacterium]|nr:MAG: cobaltochelatase subunit CobN [Clostridiales bacterium]
MFKIIYYTTTDGEYTNVVTASERLKETYPGEFNFQFFGRNIKRSPAEMYDELDDTDFILFTLMGENFSYDEIDSFLNEVHARGITTHIQSSVMRNPERQRALSRESRELREEIERYIFNGGVDNYVALFIMLANRLKGANLEQPAMTEIALDGLYYKGEVITSIEDFYRRSPRRKIRIGVLFYRSHFISGNTHVIDAYIEAGEKRGINIIPLYFYGAVPTEVGNWGVEGAMQKLFYYKGKLDIQAIINFAAFSLSTGQTHMIGGIDPVLKKLDIPVIKSFSTTQTLEQWRANANGMNQIDYTLNLIMAEYDGQIHGQMVSSKEYIDVAGLPVPRHIAYPPGVANMLDAAIKYAKLSSIDNGEKKLAIILHNYPAGDANIGTASGLDTMESLIVLLKRLKAEGFKVDTIYQDGAELLDALLTHGTNETRWVDVNDSDRNYFSYPLKDYLKWVDGIANGNIRAQIDKEWDDIPLLVEKVKDDPQILIPGLKNGNLFIGIQPRRGMGENTEQLIHSTILPPHHQYMAYYHYQADIFGADAFIHVGTHGTLEFLPGKAVAQTPLCFPNLMLENTPNFYFYIVKNPAEGAIAKRRAFATIIDYLIPKLKFVEGYDEIDQLERAMHDYERATFEGFEALYPYQSEIFKLIEALNLQEDLDIELPERIDDGEKPLTEDDFEAIMQSCWRYIYEIKRNFITMGLHTLGQPLSGEDLIDMVMVLTRLKNGDVPSIAEAFAKTRGIDYYAALENQQNKAPDGRRLGEHIAVITAELKQLLTELITDDFYALTNDQKTAKMLDLAKSYNAKSDDFLTVLKFIATTVVPNLMLVGDEVEHLIKGLNGQFIPPGNSGNISRGGVDILPTGRNFYTVDTRTVPTKSAWQTGIQLGDAVLRDYYVENGSYPQSVAIVLWGLSTIRSKGDDLAEIYYLLGVKPVWNEGSGRVVGLDIIPLKELGRPRIDVTVRISGVFRDMFPNQIKLIDRAINMIAELDEPAEYNYLAHHFKADLAKNIAAGMSDDEAKINAHARIFGARPGQYGAGISSAIDQANWQDSADLSNIYLNWGSYAYGKNQHGVFMRDAFENRLKRVEATIQNATSRETDILSVDDYYQYHGGLACAVKTVRKEMPKMYCGDSSDPDHIKLKSADKELKYVYRSRVLNNNWIDAMKQHGYKAAGDISKMFKYALGWSSTADIMDKWMYDELANKYVLDKDMMAWFEQHNPQALFNMIETLLEANQRELWNADDDMLMKLQQILLNMEAKLE